MCSGNSCSRFMFCCEKEPDNPSRAARFCLGTDTTVPAAAFFSAAISVRCHLVSHYRNKRLRGINSFRTSPRLLLKRGHILLCGLKLLNLCGLGFIHIALLHLFEHGELSSEHSVMQLISRLRRFSQPDSVQLLAYCFTGVPF